MIRFCLIDIKSPNRNGFPLLPILSASLSGSHNDLSHSWFGYFGTYMFDYFPLSVQVKRLEFQPRDAFKYPGNEKHCGLHTVALL